MILTEVNTLPKGQVKLFLETGDQVPGESYFTNLYGLSVNTMDVLTLLGKLAKTKALLNPHIFFNTEEDKQKCSRTLGSRLKTQG